MLDGWRYTPIIDSPEREATDEINHKFKRCGDCLCKWPSQLLPLLAYDLAAQEPSFVWLGKKVRNKKERGPSALCKWPVKRPVSPHETSLTSDRRHLSLSGRSVQWTAVGPCSRHLFGFVLLLFLHILSIGSVGASRQVVTAAAWTAAATGQLIIDGLCYVTANPLTNTVRLSL